MNNMTVLESEARILIVDDDSCTVEILAAILEDGGYIPVTALNAEQAYNTYMENPFPVVFTDLNMPGMSGMELLRKIRQTNQESQIIIITGEESGKNSMEALNEGAYDYLIKPFNDHSIVLPLVEKALNQFRIIQRKRLY